jgi:MATE family multidrug resistance protein
VNDQAPHQSETIFTIWSPHSPWRIELQATFTLALPIVLTQIAQVGIRAADTIFMGRLGTAELAAGALGGNFYFLFYLFGLGIVISVSTLAARARGAGDTAEVRRFVGQGFWVATAVGAPFGIALWQIEPILLLLGQTDANAALAGDYMQMMVWGLIPSLWMVSLRSFISALSRPRSVLLITVVGVVVNAFGDYALMFGNFGFPAMGLAGAGLSSSIVNTLMFLSLLIYVIRDDEFSRYEILRRVWRPDWSRFMEVFRVGLPIGATLLFEVGLFFSASILLGLISTEQLAAHQIAMQCISFTFMVPLGFAQAATIRVGLAAGARDRMAVGRAGWTAISLGGLFMVVASYIFWFHPLPVIHLFLGARVAESLEVVEFAVLLLAVAAIFQIADGLQTLAAGALRGLKDTRVPMVIAVFGYWIIGFPVSLVLGFSFGFEGVGVWSGLAAGLIVVACFLLTRFYGWEKIPGTIVGAQL